MVVYLLDEVKLKEESVILLCPPPTIELRTERPVFFYFYFYFYFDVYKNIKNFVGCEKNFDIQSFFFFFSNRKEITLSQKNMLGFVRRLQLE